LGIEKPAQFVAFSLGTADLVLGRLNGGVVCKSLGDKRKRIGEQFVREFETEAKRIPGVAFLGQGTLYPDVIESVSAWGGPSATIKTHKIFWATFPGSESRKSLTGVFPSSV